MSEYISREEILKRQYRIDDSASLSTRDVVNVEDIEDISTADVRENIHGHWIRVTDKAGYLVWECDKCGWQKRLWTNYCPDCGADMRGE